jgi:hypothetical protein
VQVIIYKTDVPSFLCLETSPAVKYLLLKKRKHHTNAIFKDREKYGEFQTLFHQLLEQHEDLPLWSYMLLLSLPIFYKNSYYKFFTDLQ